MKAKQWSKHTLVKRAIALLLAIIFLPYLIQWGLNLYFPQASAKQQVWLMIITPVATLLVMSYPLFLLLNQISKTEQQTSETKRNVTELINHAADMILISRPNGQIVHANRRASEILGFSTEQLKSMNTLDLDSEGTLNRNPKLHQKLFAGETVTFESLYKTAQGNKVPIENHISIAGWMDGLHYLEIGRDVTRRRQVEQELNDSKAALERIRSRLEQRMQERADKLIQEVQKRELTEKHIYEIRLLLENLVNSMPSAIIALDNRLKVTQWNSEAEHIFKISTPTAVGSSILNLLPEFKSNIITLMRRSNNGKKALHRSIHTEMDGMPKQFDVMLYPLSQTAGSNSPGVVIRLDDITEKAQFDEMLVQTEKMLSLGGLAAGMAHEINNPLGAILQSAQNIARRFSCEFPRNQMIAEKIGLDLSKVAEYIEQQKIMPALSAITEAGERAAVIVSDMLSFARPSQGVQTTIDIVETLKISIRLAAKDYNQKRQFDFRNIKIIENYQDDLPTLVAEKNPLKQVLLNILINAAQALAKNDQHSPPSIEVQALLDGDFMRIDIKDNGPGMPEKVRKRVFEPFFTPKEEGQGTGLGLSVSYFIVTEQLGGQLRVESIPGRGTTFSILIPIDPNKQEPVTEAMANEQYQLPL